jgi:arabinogalactan endo-1,4-beta-galactosidase
LEARGYKFYAAAGTEKDCVQHLKGRGINIIRLRVWVNQSNDKASEHCSPAEKVIMALRAQNKRMRTMIDFHYSDWWANPGKQFKPKAWETHSF